MTSTPGIQDRQVARIMGAIEEVLEQGGESSPDVDFVRRIVELEVEFQFVEDRQRVQKRVLALVEHAVEAHVRENSNTQ